jgi:hypothetical protein
MYAVSEALNAEPSALRMSWNHTSGGSVAGTVPVLQG